MANPTPRPVAPTDARTGLLISWRGDLQPIPLHRARVVFTGKRTMAYSPELDQVYRTDLQARWRYERAAPRTPLEGPLAVTLRFAGATRVPDTRSARGWRQAARPDLTNVVKAVEDAANGVLWVDDRQVVALDASIVAWGRDVRPFVALAVWRADEPATSETKGARQ